MDQDQQRDYAEENYNRRTMEEYDGYSLTNWECPWCGEPIDYCQGHGELNSVDPNATIGFPWESRERQLAAGYQAPNGHGAVFASVASGVMRSVRDILGAIGSELTLWSAYSTETAELMALRRAVIDLATYDDPD